MSSYFFYGTLCDPEIAREILGRPLSGCSPRSCKLSGYKRVYVAGATYPGLAVENAGVVDGILVARISPIEQSRLSRFEGPEYDLQDLDVVLADGRVETARVFIPKPTLKLTDRPWRMEEWRRLDKRRFLNGIKRNVLI
jgi:gamma-glutamylcyclotransferase (GGCT)/AIG2-like uncharacterized protein YtfP